MMTKAYKLRIEKMLADLQAHPLIEIEQFEIQPSASPANIATASRLAGGRLPKGVEAFYRELNGLQLTWRHTVDEIRKGDQTDFGYINLMPVERIFADWKGITWFDSFPGGERFRAVKPFDLFQPETCACFLQNPGTAPGDFIAFHYFGESLVETGYTFEDYIEFLIASRGFWGWIHTLSTETTYSPESETFRKKMAVLFSDFNAKIFLPKDELIKKC